MKVVLDEGVPEPLAAHLPGHNVQSVRQLGWKGIKNGKLLDLIQAARFAAFVTNDKCMEAEQEFQRRPFAVLILSACNWPVIQPHVEEIARALVACQPGTVIKVDCGLFVPKRFRKA